VLRLRICDPIFSIDTTPAEGLAAALSLTQTNPTFYSGVPGEFPLRTRVAHALHAPLDLFLVRKLVSRHPGAARERSRLVGAILDQH